MDYIVYFIFPFVLGLIGKKLLGQKFKVFIIGLISFFIAWIICQTISGILTSYNIKEGMLIYTLIISLSAGIFEETARYIVFSKFKIFQDNKNWNSSIMYALGHHGMETIIVGFGLLLTFLIIKYKPDAISDPQLLENSKSVLELGFWVKIYNSFERLLVGLIIHSSYTCVVVLSFIKSDKKYFLLAIAWHFLHDMISFNIHRISEYWIVSKSWVLIIVILYSYLLFRFWRMMKKENIIHNNLG